MVFASYYILCLASSVVQLWLEISQGCVGHGIHSLLCIMFFDPCCSTMVGNKPRYVGYCISSLLCIMFCSQCCSTMVGNKPRNDGYCIYSCYSKLDMYFPMRLHVKPKWVEESKGCRFSYLLTSFRFHQ